MILVTGAGGLVGSQAVAYYAEKCEDVIGIDNNMRSYFFGEEGSVESTIRRLKSNKRYRHFSVDIRDSNEVQRIFQTYGNEIQAVIHCAAQPSHDWASKEPHTDFAINAVGTLNLLEAYRSFCPKASFVFTSTNKVYGDSPNFLPLVERETRWDVSSEHYAHKFGIDENFGIDASTHSIFGVSKTSADLMVQEYGRYFGLNTVCFRGGCLTGPGHQGAQLHGFLSYLVKCCVNEKKYTVFGYKGKQVRDNIHSHDLVSAFDHYIKCPRPGEVYNIGGGVFSNVSMIEAIDKVQNLSGKKLDYDISDQSRIGDHVWYVSDLRKFMTHYPTWNVTRRIDDILQEMVSVECEKSS